MATLEPVAVAVRVICAPLGMVGAVALKLEFDVEDEEILTVGLAMRLTVTVFEYAETPAFVTFLR